MPFLFPELIDKSNRNSTLQNGVKCIVPHKSDERRPIWNQSGVVKRLPVATDWSDMVVSFQNCDAVVSSSLHGLILSESLGIQNRRILLSGDTGNFKFTDFYASFRGSEPNQTRSLDYAFNNLLQPLPYHKREAYAKRILKTFPIHLFQIIEDE